MRCRSEEVGSVGEEEEVAWAWDAATPIPSAASIPGCRGDGGPMVAVTTLPHHPGAMARNPIMGLKHHTPGGKNLR